MTTEPVPFPHASRGRGPRHWPYAAVACVGLAGIGLLVHALFSTHRDSRWLPERPGNAVVVEKLNGTADRGGAYRLRVRILVPPASPEEAALFAKVAAIDDDVLGPCELEDVVSLPERDWAAVEPGARLRASYQINLVRTKVIVRTLYLDHLRTD